MAPGTPLITPFFIALHDSSNTACSFILLLSWLQTKIINNESNPLAPSSHAPISSLTSPQGPHAVHTPRIKSRVAYHPLTRLGKFCPNRLAFYIAHHHASSLPPSFVIFRFDFLPDDVVLLIRDFVHELKMESMDIVGKTKEDASLPKATMTKIIKEMLPPDVRVARDTQDLLIECCVEFINLVSSESNEVCSREDKKTIAPEHVLKALEVLGFSGYLEEVYAAYEQHKLETVDTVRVGKCTNGVKMTEEEALVEQQRMFAEARARMNGIAPATKPSEAEPSLNR